MATIREVAKHAGVSIGTVSKVLNGSDERVDPAAKERIVASIRTLRYKPPVFESKQRSTMAHNLGVIVPDLFAHPLVRNSYAHLLLDGILENAAFRGWSMTIFAATMWDEVGNAVRRKYDGRCDCLIVVAPQPSHDIINSLQHRNTPVIQIGSTAWLDDISSIDIDNFEAGRIIAQHFLDLGHRKLGYVAHHQDQVSSKERYEGFKSVSSGSTPKYITSKEEGVAGFARMFAKLGADRPTALMGWHDGIALPLIEELQKLGLRVPEDISVASVDNSWDAIQAGIELTSVENPLHTIGQMAADMAIDRVLDHSLPREMIKLAPVLIPRATSGPAAR